MGANITFNKFTPKKEKIEIFHLELGVFFDGTLNNKTNTDARKNNTKAYQDNGEKPEDNNSYNNDWSNVARLWDNFPKT